MNERFTVEPNRNPTRELFPWTVVDNHKPKHITALLTDEATARDVARHLNKLWEATA